MSIENKIITGAFLLFFSTIGLVLNTHTAFEALKKEDRYEVLEAIGRSKRNPECTKYFERLANDHLKHWGIPYYTFVKDAILDSYEKPSACD